MPAIPVHHTATSDGLWDAAANVARIPDDAGASVLRRMYAWVDPNGDPATKSAYKLPHHEVDSDGRVGAANVRACRAAIAALNGARGGVDIPRADRQAVYDHLAAHLRDAGIEPPELASSPVAASREQRSLPVSSLELRADGAADGQPKLVGYAAVFDSPTDLGMFTEVIRRGAFTKTLSESPDVRALFNHDPNLVLGRTTNGTLTLAEDERGLRVEIVPPDTTWARDVMELVRRGDVSQMSFAFRTIKDRWNQDETGVVTRELLEVQLYDVSAVTYPAYEDTSVALRAALAAGIDLEPPLVRHSEEEPRTTLAVLRRRLDLASRA